MGGWAGGWACADRRPLQHAAPAWGDGEARLHECAASGPLPRDVLPLRRGLCPLIVLLAHAAF
eukprot:2317354-Lingulodinium_polyedra.AAC.1